MRLYVAKAAIILSVIPVLILAYSAGPPERKTGAPGEDNCTTCHTGSLNPAGGSVAVDFGGDMTYTPGAVKRLRVTVSDSGARVFGFQLSARLASDERNGQAGDLRPADSSTQVICDDGRPKPGAGCGSAPVQFIEHTNASTSNTFSFEWMPPAEGAGNVRVFVAANGANGNGQPTGDRIYTASYTLTPAAAGGGSADKPAVSLEAGVVNGASLEPGIAAGAWVAVRGMQLAGTKRALRPEEIVDGRLPTQLEGVSVNINGKPAFIYSVSPEQVQIQAPADGNVGSVSVEVVRNGVKSDSVTAQLSAYSPAFFRLLPSKHVVAARTDFSMAWPGGPAKPGEAVVLAGTGFGPAEPASEPGQVLAVNQARPVAGKITVTIGGAPAELISAWLDPTMPGMYRIAVRIPESTGNGDIPVVAEIGGMRSPEGVFIAVQR